MYWPFFRSKQEEMLALREIARSPFLTAVVPVIKPIAADAAFETRLSQLLTSGLNIALIMNSDEGRPAPKGSALIALESRLYNDYPKNVFPALEVRAAVSRSDVREFSRHFSRRKKVFVHRGHSLPPGSFPVDGSIHIFESGRVPEEIIDHLSGSKRVILRDGFDRQRVNGDYPDSSYFDDLVFTYSKLKYDGFGDFAIIGDMSYRRGGGEANHVALHLTERRSTNSLQCRHFVSTVDPSSTDVRTKYFDALNKLVDYTGCPSSGIFATLGVSDFCANHRSGLYRGLGMPKRWSTKHHVEVIGQSLASLGEGSWL